MLEAKSHRWIIVAVVVGALLGPLLKIIGPRMANFYAEPKRCTKVIASEGTREFCLSENYLPQ